MDVSVLGYLVLLLAVGAGRLIEMGVSLRHQREMRAQGIAKVPEVKFRWMVALHGGVLVAAALEVVLLRRPFVPALAFASVTLFLAANALRWWVMATLGKHWNIQVMDSARLGVVTTGPYQWIRHPNYVSVFVELLSLPLIHTAWLTALGGTAFLVWVLRERLRVEEAVLMANPAYRIAMGDKPRFLPRVFARAPRSSSPPQHTSG